MCEQDQACISLFVCSGGVDHGYCWHGENGGLRADKFEIYPSKLPSGQPELTTEEMQVRQDREITRNRSGI